MAINSIKKVTSSAVTLATATDNQVATVTGTDALTGESNLTFDGSTLTVTGAMTVSSTSTFSGDATFNDNVKVTLGTGGDADLYYDGTNVVLDPAVVGSGFFSILTKTKSSSSVGSGYSFNAHSTNASYSGDVIEAQATRAATNQYDLIAAFSGDYADREFVVRGDGEAFADGSFTGSGADYQEYFESTDGTAIEVGVSVVLESDKVRPYNSSTDAVDDIIGIVRPKEDNKNSAVRGNSAWNHWTDKYLTDDWGVYLREDIVVWEWIGEDGEERAVYERDQEEGWTPPEGATQTVDSVRKLNPTFDESQADTYTSRHDRAEWNLIGLLGQIQIKAGEPTNPRWIKMKDISANVELWYVR